VPLGSATGVKKERSSDIKTRGIDQDLTKERSLTLYVNITARSLVARLGISLSLHAGWLAFCGAGKSWGKNYVKEKKAPIYTTYDNIYTTFGLGVRHTGHPGRPGVSGWPATPGFSASMLGPLGGFDIGVLFFALIVRRIRI
jgi:hypothetical protein